ncbi:spore germination protein [Paenibacillus chartarius]|uniref:Spore germination protein n=1 Tax=Paenibacillus chartarius TaxID=747481 RepID=A0ABV6DFB0_9BACL
MPSFVGAFKVVSNGGTLNNGDTFIIAPTSSTKSYFGAGSSVTGDLSATFSLFSATITNDPDVVDDSTAKAATGS